MSAKEGCGSSYLPKGNSSERSIGILTLSPCLGMWLNVLSASWLHVLSLECEVERNLKNKKKTIQIINLHLWTHLVCMYLSFCNAKWLLVVAEHDILPRNLPLYCSESLKLFHERQNSVLRWSLSSYNLMHHCTLLGQLS